MTPRLGHGRLGRGRPGRGRPGRIRELAVVVPARNEECLIERCVTSLLAARDHARASAPSVRIRLLVVLDACSDGTGSLVSARSAAGVDKLAVNVGRVGVARATGIDHLLGRRSLRRLEQVWIANTDADSAVPVTWLSHQIDLAESGADVVVGTVRPDPLDLSTLQNVAWQASHTPGLPNGHVHGANLGVRASAYRLAGGFDPVDEHEDNRLVSRLRANGATIVASDVGEVLTSGRRVGRTPAGYAEYLALSLPDDPGVLEEGEAS